MQIKIENNKEEIKAHGNFEFPFDVSLESIEAYENGMFWWHWHREIELTLILDGEIEYRINDKIFQLKKDEGIFGNSNVMHAGYQIGRKSCHYVSITFHPRFLYGYTGSGIQMKYTEWITGNKEWDALHLKEDVSWQQEILSLMRQIYDLSLNEPIDYELQVHVLLMQIWQRIYAFYRTKPETVSYNEKNIERLRDIIQYLEKHYDQDIHLDDVAQLANICKSECCRFFKKHMKMTVMDYLMMLRIQNSLSMLENGDGITETAGKVGFQSPAYFGQIFKRYMNCTPREYRAKHKKEV